MPIARRGNSLIRSGDALCRNCCGQPGPDCYNHPCECEGCNCSENDNILLCTHVVLHSVRLYDVVITPEYTSSMQIPYGYSGTYPLPLDGHDSVTARFELGFTAGGSGGVFQFSQTFDKSSSGYNPQDDAVYVRHEDFVPGYSYEPLVTAGIDTFHLDDIEDCETTATVPVLGLSGEPYGLCLGESTYDIEQDPSQSKTGTATVESTLIWLDIGGGTLNTVQCCGAWLSVHMNTTGCSYGHVKASVTVGGTTYTYVAGDTPDTYEIPIPCDNGSMQVDYTIEYEHTTP